MQTRRQKIKKVLIIVGIILIIVFVFFLFSKKTNTNSTKDTKGKFFLDLGSLFTGKRQSPDGIGLPSDKDNQKDGGDSDTNNLSGSPFVVAGLPSPTPIAQNIGGGFGTNNINLLPDGENPNNCIGCTDFPVGPDIPGDEPVNPNDSNSSYVFINAVPSSIHKNDEVTVSWDSYNVNLCTASSFPVVAGWNNSIAKQGNKSFTLRVPTTFVVKCTTSSGHVQASDSVSIVPDEVPVCDTNDCSQEDPNYDKIVSVVMEASPYLVNKNTTSTLTWNSENANSCNAHSIPQKDDWKGFVEDSEGDKNVLLDNEPVTYVLTCTDGKTTGQTDVTISIDTSGIGDEPVDDDPVDLCNQSGQEQNPLCKSKDIDYEEEVKMLILTDEEQAELDELIREVAVMSPTLPSNQTVGNLDISQGIYETLNSDVTKDIQACFVLNKDQGLIDALWERGMAGRRSSSPKVKEEWKRKYPQGWPSQTVLAKYKAATNIMIDKEPPALTAPHGMFINGYAINWAINNIVIPKIQKNTVSTVNNDPTFSNVKNKLNDLKKDLDYIKFSGRVSNEGLHQGILNAINQSIVIIDDSILSDKVKKERLINNSGYELLPGYITTLNSNTVYTGSAPGSQKTNNTDIKDKLSDIVNLIDSIQIDPLTGKIKSGTSTTNIIYSAFDEILKDPSILEEINTFITPPIWESNTRFNGPFQQNDNKSGTGDYRSRDIHYEWWPYYWRLQEQVEYGAGTKGVDLY